MRQYLHTTALVALCGLVAADASAQQRPSTAVAEWRAPLPRTELHGRYQGAELYAVEMLNHNVGWAVGGHSGTHSTIVFRTNDGGRTWERQTMFDGESHGTFFHDIGFADANNGWIAGRHHILRTTDGGESWAPVDMPRHSGAPMTPWANKLLVLGPDAIITGSSTENGQIWRTLDGGANWEVIALVEGGGGGAGSNNTVSGLALAEPSTVFATTGTYHGNRGVIYRSNDGGHSWEVVEEADMPLLGIAFRGRRGVAVGKNIAFWTDDGGTTWRRVSIPGIQQAVDFADDNTVVAVGNQPYVVISRNGGRTWQQFTAPPNQGNLVDIEAVDPGWWFVAGGYGANALFHYVDPNHLEPIVTGTLPVPVDVQLPGGGALPRGLYDVTMGHQGDQHVVKLNRRGDVPANTPPPQGLENATTQQSTRRPPTCATPCQATIPAGGVTYERENVGPGQDPKTFLFRLTLEPTSNGVAVVARTAVTPPRNVALALAAVGTPTTTEREARPAAAAAAERAGGLLGRVRRAAAGDVRGAVAGSGINPQASQQRLRAAKAAPPAVYKLTVRHSLNLFGPQNAPSQ